MFTKYNLLKFHFLQMIYFCYVWFWSYTLLQINASTHQHQTVTDSPYAKPNKATKSSPSPQPTANLQSQQLTSVVPPTGGSGKQNQLDSMLGNLQADMSRQGVNTTQKGCCNACDKPIVGQVPLSFLDSWHEIEWNFTSTDCKEYLVWRL